MTNPVTLSKPPGHFGFPAIVPGTAYAACAIHASQNGHEGLPAGTWIATAVVHVGDDPLHEFLDEQGEDAADNSQINAIHRADFRRLLATSHSFGPHITVPRDRADDAKLRKRLRLKASSCPHADLVTVGGGRFGLARAASNGEQA